MAFERIGLGGILTFDERKALGGMKRARLGFARLQSGAKSIGSGLSSIGSGMQSAALAMLPVAAGVGLGIKKAADFEKQMSGVGAITRATQEDMAALTAEAKRQGVVSVFSAQQSAEAMEFMGRAGFNTEQIIKGLGGVMNAAAAEGIDLATSADIIAKVVKGMGLAVDEATHAADVLALTSAKTNTSITALGESFTYGAPQAKAMGISVEETAAVFGKLADAGLRGSIGGTSFTNMLVKISKPSKKATAMMSKWGISLNDARGNLRPLPDIIEQFKGKISKLPTATDRAAAASEIFGIRGAKAYSALALAGGDALRELTQDLEASSFGMGAAAEMAEKRLDNLLGAFTLFGSSLEAASIEFFGPMLNSFKEATQDMTGGLNAVLFSIQGLKKARDSFSVAAVKASKREAAAITDQLDLQKALGGRMASTARAGIQALSREAIGQEKLTRAQRLARNKSLAAFVEGNLTREKLSKKELRNERQLVKAFMERAEAGKLTAADEQKIRARFLKSIERQAKGVKGLKGAQQDRSAASIQAMIKERAEQARMEASADALLERESTLAEVEEKHGRTARLIAEGVLDAIDEIKAGFATVVARVKEFGDKLRTSIGEDRLRQFTKIAITAGIVAAAMAPLLIALSGVGFVLKSVFIPQIFGAIKIVMGLASMASGLAGVIGGVLSAAFWPLVIVLGVLLVAFLAIRKENESIGETFARIWGGIKETALSVWNTAIKPFWEGFRDTALPLLDELGVIWDQTWSEIKGAFYEVVETFSQLWDELASDFGAGTSGMSMSWREFGSGVATVIGEIAKFYVKWIGGVVKGFLWLVDVLAPIIITPFTTLWNSAKGVIDGVLLLFQGSFYQGVSKIFTAIQDVMLIPIRMLLKGILGLVDALPDVVKFAIPGGKKTFEALEKFAKYGLAGPPQKVPKVVQTVTKGAEEAGQLIQFPKKGRRRRPQLAELTEQQRTAAIGAGAEVSDLGRVQKIMGMGVKNAGKAAQVEQMLSEQRLALTKKNVMAARDALNQQTQARRKERQRQEKLADKKLEAKVQLKDERKTTIKNRMCVEGQDVATATAKHNQSIFERSGAQTEPFIRRMATETGTRLAGNSRG